MLIAKDSLKLRSVCAPDKGRYVLNTVCIEDTGVLVAADGAVLLAVLPAAGGMRLSKGARALVSGDDIGGALRVLKEQDAEVTWGETDAMFSAGQSVTLPLAEDKFPDYPSIIPPASDATLAITFNAQLLSKMLRTMLSVAGPAAKTRDVAVQMRFSAADATTWIVSETPDGRRMLGAVSPFVRDECGDEHDAHAAYTVIRDDIKKGTPCITSTQ